MIFNRNSLISILPAIVFFVACGNAHAWMEDSDPSLTLPLSFVEIPDSRSTFGQQFFNLDENDPTRIAFPTEAGFFLIRFNGNELVVDRNGNGLFDEGDGRPVKKNETFYIDTLLAGRKTAYPMRATRILPHVVYLEGRGAWVGHDGEIMVILFDHNINGIFGDFGQDRFKVLPFSTRTLVEMASSGDAPCWIEEVVPLGKFVSFKGKFLSVSVHEQDNSLTLAREMSPQGRLIVDPGPDAGGFYVLLAHKQGLQFQPVTQNHEEIVLAEGEYRLLDLSLILDFPGSKKGGWLTTTRGKKERTAYLQGVFGFEQITINIKPGENRLRLGMPLRLACHAAVWGENYEQFKLEEVKLVGAGGEFYRFAFFGEVPSVLRYYLRSGNKSVLMGELGDETHVRMSWGMIPFEFLHDPDAVLELRLTAKGLKPIVASYRLESLRQGFPPGSMLLSTADQARRAGRFSEAADMYRLAAEKFPDDALILNYSAWFLLTMESEEDRDPRCALSLAMRAAEQTHNEEPNILDTLALAFFENKEIAKAVEYQKLAVKLSPGNPELRRRLESFSSALEKEEK
ncbi:MAG: hypothetical protein ABIK28_02180 [Planctomycetota bacterium]